MKLLIPVSAFLCLVIASTVTASPILKAILTPETKVQQDVVLPVPAVVETPLEDPKKSKKKAVAKKSDKKSVAAKKSSGCSKSEMIVDAKYLVPFVKHPRYGYYQLRMMNRRAQAKLRAYRKKHPVKLTVAQYHDIFTVQMKSSLAKQARINKARKRYMNRKAVSMKRGKAYRKYRNKMTKIFTKVRYYRNKISRSYQRARRYKRKYYIASRNRRHYSRLLKRNKWHEMSHHRIAGYKYRYRVWSRIRSRYLKRYRRASMKYHQRKNLYRKKIKALRKRGQVVRRKYRKWVRTNRSKVTTIHTKVVHHKKVVKKTQNKKGDKKKH